VADDRQLRPTVDDQLGCRFAVLAGEHIEPELAPAGCAEALAVVSFTRRLLFVDGVNDQQQA
jgi:hypothetical protein